MTTLPAHILFAPDPGAASTGPTSGPAAPEAQPSVVTGVQLMQGIGHKPALGFWADAWQTMTKRKTALFALGWIGIVAFFALFAPLLASGHPLLLWTKVGDKTVTSSPWFDFLTPADAVLILFGFVAIPLALVAGKDRAKVIGHLLLALAAAMLVTLIGGLASTFATGRDPSPLFTALREFKHAGALVGALAALTVAALFAVSPLVGVFSGTPRFSRLFAVLAAAIIAGLSVAVLWTRPLENFNYAEREAAGEITAVYTAVPWSPGQRFSSLDRKPPMTTLGTALSLPPGTPTEHRRFLLGTDAVGADVLTQLLHACRLSITIGLVSTGIALVIGVTMGALMGYFGGVVDLLLYRVVEVFMAVPVLFLLIVAVAVLPPEMRSTYLLMAMIGCFTWTGMARFTRAEFLKLRRQDFVQAAQAVGLPLRSILFKHMLPNGVAPVLVDTSFAVAAAISTEAVLSYLGLGPIDQASWGKLLSSAINSEGAFKWWLAVFPGLAIFLTVLSYNMIGEALRDAIDPKLKKAAV
jgi:peptide/nickel transport system permease protein